MKVMYKSKQIATTTQNYNELVNKPYINSKELIGNITSGDLDMYNQSEVDSLIASNRAVKHVTSLPSPTVPNTLYYAGPTADGQYHVYLANIDNNVIDLGFTPVSYQEGEGIEISSDYTISAKEMVGATETTDGELGAVPTPTSADYNKVLRGDGTWGELDVMTGATETAAGKQGLVPEPAANEHEKFLRGDGTWAEAKSYWVGTQAEYNAIAHEADKLYIVKD